jgi:hypothetical protein
MLPANSASAADTALINLQQGDAQTICSVAEQMGADVAGVRQNAPVPDDTRLIIFAPRQNISDASAKQIGDAVQHGASLLVVFDLRGNKDAFNMSFMLPTMAWDFGHIEDGPFSAVEFDPEMFGSNAVSELGGMAVPSMRQIRPFHAVERGQARYDELERQVLFTRDEEQKFLPPGSNEWTRPLLDRDWRIRARVEGDLALPLLITGQYGRGRVAVFAAAPDALDNDPQAKAFWGDVIKWLLAEPAAGEAAPEKGAIAAPVVTIDREHRALNVELKNASSTPFNGTVIAREMTWEPAIIGDVERPITVPAGGEATVAIPLPANDQFAYAAVADRDDYQVRLGVLSGDGSELLSEMRFHADLRPPLLMTLDTDDVRSYAWPFAPSTSLNPEGRMGTRMDEYAYKPGETVHAEVSFDNGTRNIAKLATPKDETTPDNPSTRALNHGYAAGERKPDTSLREWGTWNGKRGVDNVVSLTFPRPVLMNAIHLIGAASDYRRQDRKNPSGVVVEVDGKEVARDLKLVDEFIADKGDVPVAFDAVRGTTVRLTLPWKDDAGRDEPTLGDVQVWGTEDESFPPAAHGTVSLSLYDAFADKTVPVGSADVDVPPGGHAVVKLDVPTPKTDGKPNFCRLIARFAEQTASRPLMTIEPRSVLASLESLKGNPVEMGFIVTRGFRNVFKIGTGTQEIPPGVWATPDDLVWGYEHGMKENGDRSPYLAAKLYVTENDMRHYSTQWRDFQNGEAFYDVGTPRLVQNFKTQAGWADADTAVLGHSDRWDAGPPVLEQFSWQEFIAFDQWLREKKLGKLTGRTKQALVKEVQTDYLGPWYAFHLEQYEHSVQTLKDAFVAAGKRLLITAQGCPLVPPAFAQTICDVIRGTSDDSTWGMQHDDVTTTTGKQMGAIAFNPYLQMATLAQWQYNSNTLNNAQWHVPVGTTEPSRRHQFDRAFRGVLRMDGSFTSMHSYGFNSNAGDPMTLSSVDYDQWKQVRDLFSLIQPEAPLGAGLVIANSYLDDPKNTHFEGSAPEGSEESHAIMRSLGLLERAGVSVSFSANVLCLDKWRGTAPLIVLNLPRFTTEELEILHRAMARGVRVAALWQGDLPLPAEAAELFGVDRQGAPTSDGRKVGVVDGRPIVAKGAGLFIPLAAESMNQTELDSIGGLVVDALQIPIKFESGSTGYGFVSNGRQFIVLQDWREEARILHVRLRAGEGSSAAAVNVNDSVRLNVHRDGDDWLIDVPTRVGDGNLVCVHEN